MAATETSLGLRWFCRQASQRRAKGVLSLAGLNWDKARADSRRAREQREDREAQRSGQRGTIRTDAKPISSRQRAYIESLEAELGVSAPIPPFAWQARNRITHLLNLKRT